jgi:hypothetical protein
MKIKIIYILILSIIIQFCITPDLKVKYIESNIVDEIKYPINTNHTLSTVDNKLIVTINNPTYTDGTIVEYDKESYFEEFKYDSFREGLIAIMFGINIPIIFGEYIYYKMKYPKIEKKNKKGFLENKGYAGSSLPLYKSPFELSNMENEVSKYDDKIIFSINIDKLHDDIYNFKKSSTSKIYTIDYSLCDDFKNRNYNNVDMKTCSTLVKNIEIQEIITAISKSKSGASLVSKVTATIKEEERQEKLRQQEEARQQKIREQEYARNQRENRDSGGGTCSLFRSTYSSARECGLDCARAGHSMYSSALTRCLQNCERCMR